jgi:mannose-6-phosphate isomerase-like protein (cupin superfamily)
MKSKWVLVTLLGVLGAAVYGGIALATPPNGVVTTTIAVGRFADINVKSKTALPATTTTADANGGKGDGSGHRTKYWKARINTRGASDLHVLQNTIAPGGTFGWHSHPGPSLVIVKSGTATFYMGDDPTCAPVVVEAGTGFIDSGSDIHVVRNEGTVDLVTVVVSLVPAGFARRIDQPAPATCPALPNG